MPFYENIADDYDAMTDFDGRLAVAEAFIRRVLEFGQVRSLLDAAAGTGLYALAGARCGIPRIVAADISHTMLQKAREHADRMRLHIECVAADMKMLSVSLRGAFGLVLCMGNSIPHITAPARLLQVLCGFRKLTAPGGLVCIQTLNYDRILAKRERIVSIDRQGEREFIRFYDFPADGGAIRFNLLRVQWPKSGSEPVRYDLHGTLLYPYRKRELQEALECAGFAIEGMYGSLALDPFDERNSPTCLAIARNRRERGRQGS